MKEHFDFMNLDLVFIDGLMLVHTSGKNQHAHTKLVPKIREILVRKPGRVQLPAGASEWRGAHVFGQLEANAAASSFFL